MCGFTGYIHGTNSINHHEIIQEMLNTIIHRGPDSGGVYTDDDVTLGFRRLSIIDLSESANQPLITPDRNVILVFNGEIYNFQELRAELQQHGYTFKTSSDSEVLLNGYLHFGIDILYKIRGMFAFCIWDKVRNRQFIARDHFGIKPLYYTQHTTDNSIIFGSEIKSFLPHPSFIKELNHEALRPYLTFQYPVTDETFFKGVYKLIPGHYMIIENKKIQMKQYWAPTFEPTNDSYETLMNELQDTLAKSVQAHKISDVKVGSFLSGGVDSSYIAKLLMPNQTYSVGFNNYEAMFDETKIAKELSDELKIQNKSKYITADEVFAAVSKIQWHMDEPDANLSSLALYFLSELASKDVTVVLSGEGADELFGGYQWYMPSKKQAIYENIPSIFRKPIASIAKKMPKNKYSAFFIKGAQPIEERYIGPAYVWAEQDALKLLKPLYQQGKSIHDVTRPVYAKVANESQLIKMQHLDMLLWLPHQILLKADKMSMAHSLELRVPFLDKEVYNVAKKVPDHYKVSEIQNKIILRDAAKKELPESWAKRKKLGFPVPMSHWLREEKYANIVKEMFNRPFVQEFFNTQVLFDYLDEHMKTNVNHARYIWTAYTFCIWYEQFFPEKTK